MQLLGRVAGCVQNLGRDVAQRKCFSFAHALERKRDACLGREHVRRVRRLCERPPGGDVIGVNVGVDHEVDFHAGIFCGLKVGLDIANGINHRCRRLATAAEEVGDANRIMMQELAQNHGLALLSKGS